MSLAAIDCVRRGVASLRANWELVLAQWLATLLVVGISIAGILPVLAVLGLLDWASLPETPGAWESWAQELIGRVREVGPPLLAAFGGTLAVWTLAFLVYCYFQGAVYGVLVAADRQAPAGVPRDYRLFRTFAWRDLFGWGGRYLWRFFWFYNLYLVVISLVVFVGVLLVALAVYAGSEWGAPAGVGIGCGGALPLVFVLLVSALWMVLAQADLARADSGVMAAARRGWRMLGRRLGGVLLISLLGMIASFAAGMVFAPFAIGIQLATGDNLPLQFGLRFGLNILQSLAGGIVGVAFAGSFVALLGSEAPEAAA